MAIQASLERSQVGNSKTLGIGTKEVANMTASPNPFSATVDFKYNITTPAQVSLNVYDLSGKLVYTVANKKQETGVYTVNWNAQNLPAGVYIAQVIADGKVLQSIKTIKN
jgi:flagellar hook assembly protein FlgD